MQWVLVLQGEWIPFSCKMIGDKAPNSLLSKDLFRNFILWQYAPPTCFRGRFLQDVAACHFEQVTSVR